LHSASVFKRRRISLTCFEDTSVIRHIAGVPRGLSNQPVQKMREERMKHPEGLLPNLCGVLANRCKVTKAAVRRHRSIVIAISFIAILGGCDKKKVAEPDIRPVRTSTVEPGAGTEKTTLTGEIRARYETDLGFRIDGKIIERPVDIGSTVRKGDLLAQIDPQPRQQDLQSARADAAAAQATLARNQSTEARQAQLLKDGFATRATYDDALAGLRTAQSQVASTSARLTQAEENLGYTQLRADADGVISTVSASTGQVVSAGQHVVRLAQPGEREAVFNVSEAILAASPKKPPVTVVLSSNHSISVVGSVRYVSPQADATTRTYEVRISLPNAPVEMRMGATVTGSVSLDRSDLVELPGSALFEQDGKPAVWVVDSKAGTVFLKPVSVGRFTGDRIVLSGGLDKGDVVVTAGVQKLIPGQKVRLLEAAAR
jgi:RND family efflux transporter MFP subunit